MFRWLWFCLKICKNVAKFGQYSVLGFMPWGMLGFTGAWWGVMAPFWQAIEGRFLS